MAVRREDLARFDDRYTLRYTRLFHAPIERVWRAVTTAEELNVWLYPISRVEARLGGRVSFTWGGPEHDPQVGEITVFEPPHRVRFRWTGRRQSAHGAVGYIEFALEAVDGGTRFTFIDSYDPGFRHDQSGVNPHDKAASLPAGPDTPWRPGFVAGFHLNFDYLCEFLSEDWSAERIREQSETNVEIASGKREGSFAWGPDSPWAELVELYHEHIRRTCPPAAG